MQCIKYFSKFKPSSLDRKKMDQIIKKTDHVAQINNNFGSKFSLVRGVGSTGKTIALLQALGQATKNNQKEHYF